MDVVNHGLKDELARRMLRSSVRLTGTAIVSDSLMGTQSGLKGVGLACELLMRMVYEGILTFEEANALVVSESDLACGECYNQDMAKADNQWVIENALKILGVHNERG